MNVTNTQYNSLTTGKAGAAVVMQFQDQAHLDLWKDWFSGQVSDGQWEHRPRTRWLWGDTDFVIGKKNIITVHKGDVGDRWFQFTDMIPDFSDEMTEACGLKGEELRKARVRLHRMVRFPKYHRPN